MKVVKSWKNRIAYQDGLSFLDKCINTRKYIRDENSLNYHLIMVTSYEGLFFSGDFTTHQVHQDRDEQNGWHSFKGHLPHQQREDRGCEQFHKGNEKKCLRLPGLQLFRLSDLIETNKDSLYGKPSSGSSGRHYSRKNPYNQRCLKQTVFRLPDGGNKEAIWPPDYTPKDLDPNYFLLGRTPHSVNIFFTTSLMERAGLFL